VKHHSHRDGEERRFCKPFSSGTKEDERTKERMKAINGHFFNFRHF